MYHVRLFGGKICSYHVRPFGGNPKLHIRLGRPVIVLIRFEPLTFTSRLFVLSLTIMEVPSKHWPLICKGSL